MLSASAAPNSSPARYIGVGRPFGISKRAHATVACMRSVTRSSTIDTRTRWLGFNTEFDTTCAPRGDRSIKRAGLRGGVVYSDGQFDDARLLVDLVKTAAEQGATLLNYARVTALLKDDRGQVNGLEIEDLESGDRASVAARVVVNATGPFCDGVRRLAGSSRESASRFLAVLERAGVITQGRGRLTVHDPAALQGYVY